MKFSEIAALAPADVPAASIPFRGQVLDIFRLTGKDVFFVLNRGPGIVDAWSLDESDPGRVSAILKAIGDAGPEVVAQLIASGVRATPAEIKSSALGLDEEIEILLAVLEFGIPEGLVGKLLAGLGKLTARAGVVA